MVGKTYSYNKLFRENSKFYKSRGTNSVNKRNTKTHISYTDLSFIVEKNSRKRYHLFAMYVETNEQKIEKQQLYDM